MMLPPDVAGWITIESRGESAHPTERHQHSAELAHQDPEIKFPPGPSDIEMNTFPSDDVRTSLQQQTTQGHELSHHYDDQTEHTVLQDSEQIQTVWEPYKNRFRVLASCFMLSLTV